jgi:hypothetical protein
VLGLVKYIKFWCQSAPIAPKVLHMYCTLDLTLTYKVWNGLTPSLCFYKKVFARCCLTKHICSVLGEVQYVEFVMIECCDRAKITRNVLYARFSAHREGLQYRRAVQLNAVSRKMATKISRRCMLKFAKNRPLP